jgi:hypothetical protein
LVHYEVRRHSLHGPVVAARRVAAARTLDLDDAGAELGELPRGEWAGDHLFQGDDGDAFERSHRRGFYPLSCAPGGRMPP